MDSSIEPLNTLSLPEIQVTNLQEDWGFLSKPQEELDKEIHSQLKSSSPQPQTTTTTENDTMPTTGLKRALSLSRQTSDVETIRTEVINISTSNPSHLYWVPASQHPEIAPAEFEKYVQAHGVIVRKKSAKRQSVLSMYFTANDDKDRSTSLDDDEEDKIRKKVLRRSLSLQLPSTGDYARNVPDLLVFDRNSSPTDESRALVPKGDRPLLRRGARTNFKRNSSVSPYRNSTINRKSESDCIDERKEHHESTIPRSVSAEGITLFDAKDVPDETTPLSPVVESEEVRDLCISTRDPENEITPPPIVMTRSVSTSTANSSRKSNWSWAFWSEASKKKLEEVDIQPSKSSDGKRFTLSSLFSRKSKSSPQNYTSNIEKMTHHLNAPKDFTLNPMARLPLHVERAIYKLSHFKLANPRRPLHEQVLISNHMFWYLSIIATTDQPAPRKRLIKKQQPKKRAPAKNNNNTNFLTPQKSTGFVVPENYLHPTTKKPQQDSDSSSSEEDEESSSDEEDNIFIKEDDDVPLAMYKLK